MVVSQELTYHFLLITRIEIVSNYLPFVLHLALKSHFTPRTHSFPLSICPSSVFNLHAFVEKETKEQQQQKTKNDRFHLLTFIFPHASLMGDVLMM